MADKKQSNSQSVKKASLPRPNKSGKRPHSITRILSLERAARRTGRRATVSPSRARRQINPDEVVSPKKLTKSRLPVVSSRRANPGAGPASIADMQTMKRSGHSARQSSKKTKNPK